MFCEREGVGGAIADKSNATPCHEGDDDAKAEEKDKTDPVGGRLETVRPRMNSINAFGCEWEKCENRASKRER